MINENYLLDFQTELDGTLALITLHTIEITQQTLFTPFNKHTSPQCTFQSRTHTFLNKLATLIYQFCHCYLFESRGVSLANKLLIILHLKTYLINSLQFGGYTHPMSRHSATTQRSSDTYFRQSGRITNFLKIPLHYWNSGSFSSSSIVVPLELQH